MIRRYLRNVLVGIDQLVNASLGGDPDETISSRLARNHRGSWMERVVDRIFRPLDGPHHCEQSLEPDEGKDEVTK